ncbi:4Fe-4S binding protein [Candidatus Bathyarchaeota archaeon]|nr:4Fe-4S binding protein [Candidatus Bathyarchaeota archaeon]MBL7168128.1 4Fe-4S binding protein [Candidatus Bathyarchaeota archaeon]
MPDLVRVMLRFSKEIVDRPITSQVILEQGTPVNILSAHMNQQGGEILVDIESAHADKVIKAFRDKGVTVDVRKLVEKDDDKCIDCGACVSICPMDALTFDEAHTVVLDEEKCNGITCGLCVDACTTRAIRLLG